MYTHARKRETRGTRNAAKNGGKRKEERRSGALAGTEDRFVASQRE